MIDMKPIHSDFLNSLLVPFAWFCPALEAGVFCVDSSAELQAALQAARKNGVDDEIRVVQGAYVGNFVFDSSEPQGLYLIGGYLPNCRERVSDPDATVLNGNQVNTVLDISSKGVSPVVVIRGLSLINGRAVSNEGAGGDGGGLHAKIGDGGSLVIEGSILRDNNADRRGGGLYAKVPRGTLLITNSSLIGNVAQDKGGAGLVGLDYGTLDITDSLFMSNIAGRKGGVLSIDAVFGSTRLAGNRFLDNAASDDGGGIDMTVSHGTASFTGNHFEGNLCGDDGGAVHLEMNFGEAYFTENLILGNTAADDGGGLNVLSEQGEAVIHFSSNSFEANLAEGVGGASASSLFSGALILTNNTIQGSIGKRGAGLHMTLLDDSPSSFAYLSNNLLWQNVTQRLGDEGSDLWIDNDGDGDRVPSTIVLRRNNFDQTVDTGVYVTIPFPIDPNNFNAVDPLLVRGENGLLSPSADSSMINVGLSDVPDLSLRDVSGMPRIFGPGVDLGAVEYLSAPIGEIVNCVFDGAQATHPDVLSPPTSVTDYSPPYFSRSFVDTGIELLVSELDWRAYLQSSNGDVFDFGSLNALGMSYNCIAN